MTTTDGLMLPTTPTKSFCKVPAIAGDAGAEAVGVAPDAGASDAGGPDATAPVVHAAIRSNPPSRSAPRRGGALLLGIGVLAFDKRDVWFIPFHL
jgi:hypothetical protein